VRKELGIEEDVKLALNFGWQPTVWKLKEEFLPSGWLCLVPFVSYAIYLP
ncbi:hypothetical protein PanWU01x14_139940, partial [Parasponia andersonii]